MAFSDRKAPSTPPKGHAAAERLDSWKEIAVYLNRDVRTVQRWEHSKGLPVHRLGEGKRAPAYALRAELDTWLRENEGHPNKTRPTLFRRGLPAFGMLVIAALVVWRFTTGRTPRGSFKVAPITSNPGVQLHPTLSPDGGQLAFVWDAGQQGTRDLYVTIVGEERPQRLAAGPLGSPEWSPDGGRIAFLRTGFVYVVSPRGGAETNLARAITACWAPDGKSLVISDGPRWESRIYSLSLETGERKALTTPAGDSYGDTLGQFSPDGKSLAFVRQRRGFGRDIYVVEMAKGAPVGPPWRLTHDSGMIWGFAWSGSGREIVYSSDLGGRRALWRMPVSPGAQPERIPGTDEARSPAIRKSRLAFEVYTQDRNIWALDLDAAGHPARAPAKVIDSTADDHGPQISLDGARLAFVSSRSSSLQIWVADSHGRQPMQVTRFPTHAGTPRWSPDGSRIAFNGSIDQSMQIFVINADGGGLIRLMPESQWDARASWSRDGRWIYFRSTRSGNDQIWKVPSAGGTATQVTRGGAMEAFEAPDGQLLYFARNWGPDGIWSVPVDGGQETLVLDRIYPNYWAVGDQGIYYLDFAASTQESIPLMLYAFQARRRTELTRIRNPQRTDDPSFTVTRDGRRVMWAQIDRTESNLMMIEDFR